MQEQKTQLGSKYGWPFSNRNEIDFALEVQPKEISNVVGRDQLGTGLGVEKDRFTFLPLSC